MNPGDGRRASATLSLASNLSGSAVTALLTLAAVPVQVRLLGMSAFGLIALIGVLQVVMGAFDPGLATLTTRSVARDGERPQPTVNAAAWTYWAMGPCLAAALWTGFDVAVRLRPPEDPSAVQAGNVLCIVAFLCIRWPVAFYVGVLAGLQRMVLLNLLRSGCLAGRQLGGIALLLVHPDLHAFLLFLAASAAVELAVFAWSVHRLLPWLRPSPRGSLGLLRPHMGFAASMLGIGLLSMVLTQTDRAWITAVLGLHATGNYGVAYTAGMAISLAQVAFNTATLPILSRAWVAEDRTQAGIRYRNACRGMALCLAPPAMTLVFFGHDILQVWVGPPSADAASMSAAILACGFLINAVTSNAYQVTVVADRASIPLGANLLGALVYVPVLAWGVPTIGIEGAAHAWLALNLSYLATLVPAAHRILRGRDPAFGHGSGAAAVIGVTVVCFAVAAWLRRPWASPWAGLAAASIAGACAMVAGLAVAGPSLRHEVLGRVRRFL